MRVGSLFSGIGGIDLGLERAGMRVVWQCESDLYCRAVLRKHWPGIECFEDVRGIHEVAPVDLVCGGFPCQPVSLAGRRTAQKDERWLWPEFERIIRLLRPRYVLVENVPGLLTAGMGDVLGGLAALGYDAEWDCVPAAALGAPHLRDRVWIVAYPGSARRRQDAGSSLGDEGPDARWSTQDDHELDGDGEGGRAEAVAYTDKEGQLQQGGTLKQERGRSRNGDCQVVQDPYLGTVQSRRIWGRTPQASSAEWWASEPDVGRVAHGVPSRLDRLAALGNAVVPQVAEWIGRQIMSAEAGVA